MNVQQYLDRIKYTGSKDSSASTLRELCICHARNIPFEIIDMFGGPRKRLDLEKVYQDIVVNKRGGFCYENNGVFHWLLQQFGFKVSVFQSQAYVASSDSWNPRFDHMTMQVTCDDGSLWLADIGWGGSSFKEPLKYEVMLEQTQKNGRYRISKYGADEYVVEKRGKTHIKLLPDGSKFRDDKKAKTWAPVYKFDTVPRKWNDFDEMCAYQLDSEHSFLKFNTIACIATKEGDLTLWGWVLREKRYIDPDTEETVMLRKAKNQTELKELLKQYFDIELDFDVDIQMRDYKDVVPAS